MNIKLAKISLSEYDLPQCLNYRPTSAPPGSSSHVAPVTPPPNVPPLEKETFESLSATNSSLRAPQENLWQAAEGRACTAKVRTKNHIGLPPEAVKHSPKKNWYSCRLLSFAQSWDVVREQCSTRLQADMWKGDNLSCLQRTSLDPQQQLSTVLSAG